MTRKNETESAAESIDDQSRRNVLKTGALLSGGLALGLSGTGSAAAQEGDGDGNQAAEKALMFPEAFHPNGTLRIVSPVINWTPERTGFTAWSDYNTRIARYRNTNERVLLYPANDADVSQGQVYRISRNFSFLEDDDNGLIDVRLIPARDGGTGTTDGGATTGSGATTNGQ